VITDFLNGSTSTGSSAAAEAEWPSPLEAAVVAILSLAPAVISLVIVGAAVLPVLAGSWIRILDPASAVA
jgi:hypothetical protein